MVKIKLIQIGKTKEDFIANGYAGYEKKIQKYFPFETETIALIKNMSGLPSDQLKIKEGVLLMDKIKSEDRLILLDDKGKNFSSPGFAEYMQKQMNSGTKTLVFAIGGAYGFSPQVYQRADDKISLSAMTFSHQLVRLIFGEQLYRAGCILNNHPYHHE